MTSSAAASARVPVLATGTASHEAVELLVERTLTVERHGLQPSKRAQLAFGADDAFHSERTERPDHLLLEVGDAAVEADRRQ